MLSPLASWGMRPRMGWKSTIVTFGRKRSSFKTIAHCQNGGSERTAALLERRAAESVAVSGAPAAGGKGGGRVAPSGAAAAEKAARRTPRARLDVVTGG